MAGWVPASARTPSHRGVPTLLGRCPGRCWLAVASHKLAARWSNASRRGIRRHTRGAGSDPGSAAARRSTGCCRSPTVSIARWNGRAILGGVLAEAIGTPLGARPTACVGPASAPVPSPLRRPPRFPLRSSPAAARREGHSSRHALPRSAPGASRTSPAVDAACRVRGGASLESEEFCWPCVPWVGAWFGAVNGAFGGNPCSTCRPARATIYIDRCGCAPGLPRHRVSSRGTHEALGKAGARLGVAIGLEHGQAFVRVAMALRPSRSDLDQPTANLGQSDRPSIPRC